MRLNAAALVLALLVLPSLDDTPAPETPQELFEDRLQDDPTLDPEPSPAPGASEQDEGIK